MTKQKLFLKSRSYSLASIETEKKHANSIRSCRPLKELFDYQTRFNSDIFNKTISKIKKNLNFFSKNNNRSCDSFRPKNRSSGSFDLYSIPRLPKLNNSNSRDSLNTTKHYEKIMESVSVQSCDKTTKVNTKEIKFDLQNFCEKQKEKTHKIIYNSTNQNYLAKFKLPKLSSIAILPKMVLTKSPSNRKIIGERFNPFLHEPFRKNIQIRNFHGGIYPY